MSGDEALLLTPVEEVVGMTAVPFVEMCSLMAWCSENKACMQQYSGLSASVE